MSQEELKVLSKQNITVGIIFILLILTLPFFFRLPTEIEIKTSPPGIDMSNDTVFSNEAPKWQTIDIRVLNLDTVDHKVAFEMSYHPDITIVFNGTCYLEPSTYETYHNVSVREGTHAIRVVKDRTIARTNYVNFDGVKVFEIEITPETIDFGYVNTEPVYLQEIYPDAVVDNS